MNVKYFSGTQEVAYPQPMRDAEFYKRFGFASVARSYDGYSKWVGCPVGTMGDKFLVPVTRVIFRKANPSNHKCDARCQSAKGKNCECSCGGQYHGSQA